MNTHKEEQASLYVLDKLDPQERIEFEVSMEKDDALKALVRELEITLAEQVNKLPQYTPSADTFQRIQNRIRETEVETQPGKVIQLPWASLSRWAVAAIFLFGIGLTYLVTSKVKEPVIYVVGMNANSSNVDTLAAGETLLEGEDAFVQLASLASDFWDHPETLPVQVRTNQGSSSAYAIFDPESNSGFIAIQQLPKLGQNKHYNLWITNHETQQVRNAGTIPLYENNKGLYYFSLDSKLSEEIDSIDFFVTEENSSEKTITRPQGTRVLGKYDI